MSKSSIFRKGVEKPTNNPIVGSILDAAKNLLQEKELDDTSTNLIARNAGVSIGSLYQYFWNKNGIVAALIEKEIQANVVRFREKLQSASEFPLSKKTEVLVDFVIDHIAGNTALLDRMFRPVPYSMIFKFLLKTRMEVAKEIEKVLQQHKNEIQVQDLPATSFYVVQTVTQMVTLWVMTERSGLQVPTSKDQFRKHLIHSIQACWQVDASLAQRN